MTSPVPDRIDAGSSSAQRNATRNEALWLKVIAAVCALLTALGALGGDIALTVVAGGLLGLAIFKLARTRKHGSLRTKPAAWGPDDLAKRYRLAARVLAAISLALVAYGALYALGGQPEPAIVFGVICSGMVLFLCWMARVNARFVGDVARAMAGEPVRLVCTDVREPWRRKDHPPAALVLTTERIAMLQASARGVSEVASMAVPEIASVGANFHRGSLAVHGDDAELSVRRAAPVQVRPLFDELREAGVHEQPAA